MTTIIVPTYNQENFTIKCFESILENTSSDYSIIWADDCSSKKSYETVKPVFEKFVNKKYFRNETNQGFIKTVNTAINFAMLFDKPDSIVLLNNDTEVTKDWLMQMTKGLEDNSVVGAVSSCSSQWQGYQTLFKLIKKDGSGLTNLNNYGIIKERFKNVYHSVKGVSFFCVAFRTDLFETIGMLDERFGKGYGEDVDFCKRVVDAGEKIAISLSTFIHHHHHGTFGKVYDSEKMKKTRQKHLKVFKDKHGITGNYYEHK